MLFRQRRQLSFWETARLYMWPRRSFARSLRYFGKRLLRIPAHPHNVSLGFAIGVFFACSPLYGLHIVFALFFAWIFSANIAAAAFGTLLANPVTIPLLFSAAYETGRRVLPLSHKAVSMDILWEQMRAWDFSGLSVAALQICAGSVLWGGILAILAYILAYKATKRFRRERLRRLNLPHLLKYVP